MIFRRGAIHWLMANLWVLLSEFVPIGVLILYLLFDQWQRKKRREGPPIEDKLLRPAGYSLQCKIEKLQDGFANCLLVEVVFAALFGLIVTAGSWQDVPGLVVVIVPVAAGVAVAIVISKSLRNHRLGLLAEQFMGEQLQELAVQGYRIFHDVPGKGKWDIDHVAVGPGGVFAIETKCYSKKGPEANVNADFDGTRIQFPGRTETEALDQVIAGSRWLADEFLEVGERVAVQPIVALPGWFVTLKAESEIKVLSGKQVAGYIGSMPEILSPKLIQQIAHQLDQRCRTVEF